MSWTPQTLHPFTKASSDLAQWMSLSFNALILFRPFLGKWIELVPAQRPLTQFGELPCFAWKAYTTKAYAGSFQMTARWDHTVDPHGGSWHRARGMCQSFPGTGCCGPANLPVSWLLFKRSQNWDLSSLKYMASYTAGGVHAITPAAVVVEVSPCTLLPQQYWHSPTVPTWLSRVSYMT